MSEIDFLQLAHATRLVNGKTIYYEIVHEWSAKRHNLVVQLGDFPALLQAHRNRSQAPYPNNTQIIQVDLTPTVRLANACEATANCLYSMAEIAANFANKASRGQIPSSFNAIRKKCEATPSWIVAGVLGDLQWYRKIREIRTEWTHYSSLFIAENEGIPLLCIRAYRRLSDRREFNDSNFKCTLPEFVIWVQNALATVDSFAGFLLNNYVIPEFDLNEIVTIPKTDEFGAPILAEPNRFEVLRVSIREFLTAGGIAIPG